MLHTYQLDIIIRGVDNASSPLSKVSGALSHIGRIASGVLIAGSIYRIIDGFKDLGSSAVEAYTSLEKTQVSLQNLMARELARGEVIETTSQYVRDLTSAEIDRINELNRTNALLAAEEVYLQDRYNAAVEKYGEASYQAMKLMYDLEDLRMEVGSNVAEMDDLLAKEGQLITVTHQNTINQKSLAEALELAAGPAAKLTRWVERLGIITPFSEEDITSSLRVAAAYGFLTTYAADAATEEERLQRAREDGVVTAQRLVSALTDVIAGSGLPPEYIKQITVALGQVQAKGKLAAQEIHQFVNAGIGLDVMADAMGMTVSEFKNVQEEGGILAEEFLPALINLFERDFQGAADRIMNTFGGTLMSLKSISRVIARTFLGPTFERATLPLREFFLWISEESTLASIAQAGESFADMLTRASTSAFNLVQEIQSAWQRAMDSESFTIALPLEITKIILPPNMAETAQQVQDAIFKDTVDLGFESGNLKAAEGALGGMLALFTAPKVITAISLVFTLLSKINWIAGLLMVVAGGLGAAWSGNWLGIRDLITTSWYDHIQPALQGFIASVQEKLPEALETAKQVWDTVFKPLWDDFVLFIEETVIPAVVKFIDQLSEDVPVAIDIAQSWIRNTLIPGFEDAKTSVSETYTATSDFLNNLAEGTGIVLNWVTSELVPLRQVATALGESFGGPIMTFFSWFVSDQAGIIQTRFESIGKTVNEVLAPGFESAKEIFRIFQPSLQAASDLWWDVRNALYDIGVTILTEYLIPYWGEMSDLFLNSLLPTLTTFRDLWLAILNALGRLATEVLQKYILPYLEDMASQLAEKLNPAIETLQGYWSAFYDILVLVGPILDGLIKGALQLFYNKLDDIAGVFTRIQDGMRWLTDKLNNWDPNLPGYGTHLPDMPVPDATAPPPSKSGSGGGKGVPPPGYGSAGTQVYDYSTTNNYTREAAVASAMAFKDKYTRISAGAEY